MAEKYRHWNFLAYPDSLPEDWIDRLIDTHLPIYISPLHENDVFADGTQKKPHYHVIVSFDGPTTQNNVIKHITQPLNQPIPVVCLSLKGSFDYFTHEHDPDKAPYNEEEILFLSGASKELIDKESLVQDAWDQIITLTINKNIKTFRQLVFETRALGNSIINSVVTNNVLFWKEFLKP